MTSEAQLDASHLSRHFVVRTGHGLIRPKRVVRAVDDVSLSLRAGRVTAVVGESGSGKSVLARMLARIVTPTSGDLLLDGVAIPAGAPRTLDYTSRVQLVLQDPFASINPVHPIRHSLERPLVIHGTPKAEVEERARAALSRVSLEPPERYLDRYPHELSGGQLQRVSIARALCVNPTVLLADEPISMLDVSVRLGVLNLLRGLCDSEQLAVLYITHDIASARYIADETIVMYAGQVVERSEGTALIDAPSHPYTQLLISSVPDPSDPLRQAPEIEDRAGQGQFPAEGCRFAPRCPHAMDVCRSTAPPLFQVTSTHESGCWLHDDAVKVNITEREQEQGGTISTT
ncbi:MAG: ABC transporter ATP-binding protein [Acidobacteria bacterium]|nr:ABC transporter ATP-binding protein [Acidobacteriota bacterium]